MSDDEKTEERAVAGSLEHLVATSAELTAILANLNCGSADLVDDGALGEVELDAVEGQIESAEDVFEGLKYDWKVFDENFEKLKEKKDGDD